MSGVVKKRTEISPELKAEILENKKLRAALTEIACYDQIPKGSTDWSRLDKPGAARVARAVLENR